MSKLLQKRVCREMSNFAFRRLKADEKTGVNELVNEDFRRSFGDASKQKCHFATEPKRWLKAGVFSLILASFMVTSGCDKLLNTLQDAAEKFSKQKDLTNVVGQTGDTQISGRVMYTKDNMSYSVEYAKVDIKINYPSGTKAYIGYTDSNGNYNVWVESLTNSTGISVTAKAPGYREQTQTLAVGVGYAAGQTSVRASDIYLQENTGDKNLGIISGVVRYGPLPIVGATVNIVSGPVTNITAVTDQNGIYVFPGLPYGTYILSISKTDFIVKTAPDSIMISESNKVKSEANFVLKPATVALEKAYDISSMGVINAGLIYPDKKDFEPIPAIISDAIVRVLSIKDDANNYPKTFVQRDNSSFIIYGIPISANVTIELEITMDGNKLKQQKQSQGVTPKTLRPSFEDSLNKVMKHTYSVSSKALVNDQLPEKQKVLVGKEDFDFQNILEQFGFKDIETNFNFMDMVWIENEVRIWIGPKDIPVGGAKVVFSKDGIRKETTTLQNGWFGLDLPSRGIWNVEIFANNTSVFNYKANLQSYGDARSWYPGMIFIQGVKADVSGMTTKRIEFKVKKQASTVIYDPRNPMPGGNFGGGMADEMYTGPIQFVLYSVMNKEYKVTANKVTATVNDGNYYANLALLGDFKAEIISGDVKLVDNFTSYWVDEWSGNSLEVWVKESNLPPVNGKVYVQYGTTEVGVPTATIELKKGGVAVAILSGSTEVTSTKTAVARLSDPMVVGRFGFNLKERKDLEEDGWTLVISKPGVIKTKSIPLWFERDNFGEMKSNLFTLDNIKVTPITYIGKRFPLVTGKLASNTETADYVYYAAVTLNYVGANLYVTGNTNDSGNFSFTNAPALDTELEILVQKGTNIGKTDGTFRYSWTDIDKLNRGNEVEEAYIPWGGYPPQTIRVQFNGFKINDVEVKFRYNDRDFWVNGATLNIIKVDETGVSANYVSDDSGWIRGIFIPKNGSYTAKVTKTGFVDKVVYATANAKALLKDSAMNYGWDQNSIKLELTATANLAEVGIPTKSISGYVYEESGTAKTGIASQIVTFTAAKASYNVTTTTGSDGKFTVGLPRIGEYKMTVSKSGLLSYEQSVWIDDWSSDIVNDAILRAVGTTGWWNIWEFEISNAQIYENGLNANIAAISPKIYYHIRAKIQKDGQDFNGSPSFNVVLVDADTGEKVYDMAPAGADSFGSWVVTGSVYNPVFGAKGIERTTAISSARLRIEVKNANGYRIYPLISDAWQVQNTEKDVPALIAAPGSVTATTVDEATTFTWDNAAFAEAGISGSKYRIKMVAADSGNTLTMVKDYWIDNRNAYNTTLSWTMRGWEWLQFGNEWNTFNQYPGTLGGIAAGNYTTYFIKADDIWNPKRMTVVKGTLVNPVYKN